MRKLYGFYAKSAVYLLFLCIKSQIAVPGNIQNGINIQYFLHMNNPPIWYTYSMSVLRLIISYLIIVNMIGFALMGIDKRRAIRRSFRIPEATLFLVAVIGGSLGSILGMYTFRHKTRHRIFTIGMPIILIIQIAITVAVVMSPFEIALL